VYARKLTLPELVRRAVVRSNKHGNIGFLKEKQRVNVLLSRARHGMILVGSSTTLLSSKRGGAVWEPILEQLSSAGRIVNGLPTTCQLHPNDEAIELCRPDEFRRFRPNGGCLRPCTYRLACGHVCQLMCHPTDQKHIVAERNCCEPCRRIPPECTKNHQCPKLCKDECGPCQAIVHSTPLTCGHVADNARCHEVHSQAAIDEYSKKCQAIIVTHRFKCGHEASSTCANSRSLDPKCPMVCGKLSLCQHPCRNM
jgi:AAA domain